MREDRDVISCAVATASGFAMPYRTRRTDQPEKMTTEPAPIVPRNRAFDGVARTLARGTSEAKSCS